MNTSRKGKNSLFKDVFGKCEKIRNFFTYLDFPETSLIQQLHICAKLKTADAFGRATPLR